MGQPLGLLRQKAALPPTEFLHESTGQIICDKPYTVEYIEELRKKYVDARKDHVASMTALDKTKFLLVSTLKVRRK